jgi:fatty acid desaturase
MRERLLLVGRRRLSDHATRRSSRRPLVSCEASGDYDRWDTEQADPIASMDDLDTLIPRSEIRSLIRQKSNRQGLAQICLHFGWLAIMAVALKPWPILSVLGMAWVSAFFFCGLHETVHRTAFQSPILNDFWAQIFGLLTFRPARHYWYYHWQHHRYTGNPEMDSELQPGSWLDMDIRTPLGYIMYLSGIPFWIDAIGNNLGRRALGYCSEKYLKPTESSSAQRNKAQAEVVWEARLYLLVYGLLATVATLSVPIREGLLCYWILPAVLGQPILRGYLLGEHHGRKQSLVIFENTRTVQTNQWIRRLAWNMPYHLEHHAWPAVPFWKLPQLHSLLTEQVARKSNSNASEHLESTSRDQDPETWEWWDQGELLHSKKSEQSETLSGRDGYWQLNWKYFRSLVI